MPNWITNKVYANDAVIRAMLDEDGKVDFNKIIPKPPMPAWDTIPMSSEDWAKFVLGIESRPGFAMDAARNRNGIMDMDDECFQKFVGMMENYRRFGYLHGMDFARNQWGTKWNACETKVNPMLGFCQFDTAWECPIPVFLKLSEMFPHSKIRVDFADEDAGSNCGRIVFRDGKMLKSDIAPKWDSMDKIQQQKWVDFAYRVKGWDKSRNCGDDE